MGRERTSSVCAAACAFLVLAAQALDGGEPLKMQVTPPVSIAPGYVRVRVSFPAAPENRRLQVVAESRDFYRSSEVQLEGAGSAPLNVFEFRNLPAGEYEVTGVLIGVNGPRATAFGIATVQP